MRNYEDVSEQTMTFAFFLWYILPTIILMGGLWFVMPYILAYGTSGLFAFTMLFMISMFGNIMYIAYDMVPYRQKVKFT